MSNLATVTKLSKPAPQLPVAWYFDKKIHDLEQAYLFNHGPNYVGHEIMVPNQGDYYPLPMLDNANMLVRNDHGIELISNVCRHRQALMHTESGNAQTLVCPLHRWTYDMGGKLLGAPKFPDNPCLNLPKSALQNWRGMLFNSKRNIAKDLAHLGVTANIDFDAYLLEKIVVKDYEFNWKTFVEVYLEDYHVEPFHPGLNSFVDCSDLQWEFGDWHSVQTVGYRSAAPKTGTPNYEKWHEVVRNYNGGAAPKQGAIWMVYYPNLMIEWYPHVLVVSNIIPRGPAHCTHVTEFYYPEDIALFEREFVAVEQQAYAETAVEDDIICERMNQGRRALWRQGLDDAGPYQLPLEAGMQHFHEFLQRQIGTHL